MAQAGQNPTNAVSTNVAAVPAASHIHMPGVNPASMAPPTSAPAMMRPARSHIGRLRFKYNMKCSLIEVNNTNLESLAWQKDSGTLKN